MSTWEPEQLGNSTQEVRELAQQMRPEDTMGGVLRMGVVSAITRPTISVQWGANTKSTPNVRHLLSYIPRVGDTVWGIRDGDDVVVIGLVANNLASHPYPAGLMGWCSANVYTNGRADGRYGGGWGEGVQSIAVNTGQTGLGLGCVGVPCPGGRVLRARYHFAAAGPVNTGVEWYFKFMASKNGAAFVQEQEHRWAPAGINGPSPEGECLFASASDTTSIGVGMDVQLSGSTGTVWRYSGTYQFRSHFTLEDLGPA